MYVNIELRHLLPDNTNQTEWDLNRQTNEDNDQDTPEHNDTIKHGEN